MRTTHQPEAIAHVLLGLIHQQSVHQSEETSKVVSVCARCAGHMCSPLSAASHHLDLVLPCIYCVPDLREETPPTFKKTNALFYFPKNQGCQFLYGQAAPPVPIITAVFCIACLLTVDVDLVHFIIHNVY